MINVKISKKVFNDKYIPLLDEKSRYIVMYGGGSSGKSYFIAQRYIYKMMKTQCRLLVIRQTGNTNRDSTYALFKQVISNWKLSSLFSITDLRVKCVNGNEIIFRGLDDVEKIKSTTFENGELTDIWVEEATETQEADIQQLKVRLRGGTSKKQMVLSFNPINISHWIKRHFVDKEVEKDVTVMHSTYKDNKFLSEDDIKALESFKYSDPYYYDVYCLGQWRSNW
jgi:phage terminase large subunit